MPPRRASSSARASARSAVSATAPTPASASFSTRSRSDQLPGSAMRPRTAPLATPLTLRGGRLPLRAGNRHELRRLGRLLGERLLRLLERGLGLGVGDHLVLPPCKLGLPLLLDRQYGRGDEDGRVGA